ncbi:MAG: Holliday junction resolvase Hjc [Candidatus Methanofastidiosia archaeon]
MYGKGAKAERDIVKKLWEMDFAAIRMPGSGRSSVVPHPDILAGNRKLYLGIEIKTTKRERYYFNQEDVKKLVDFSSRFGCHPLMGIRFVRRWRFFKIDDLAETRTGFRADFENGKDIGEIISILGNDGSGHVD